MYGNMFAEELMDGLINSMKNHGEFDGCGISLEANPVNEGSLFICKVFDANSDDVIGIIVKHIKHKDE